MHLPVAAQHMMAAVLNKHDIVMISHISHNCFFIIVFLYSQEFWGNNNPLLYYQSTVTHLSTWLIRIHHYGRDWVWIMTLVLLGPHLIW